MYDAFSNHVISLSINMTNIMHHRLSIMTVNRQVLK